jgi:predicted Zn-dependent peptidase
MLGWSVKQLDVADSPATNVMMSMFLRRLERAYADAGIDATVELKIAGYYGLRTMRATVTAVSSVSPKTLTDVLIKAVNRLCDTEASESRLERSKNAAMVEKLDKYERTDDAALEIAWQLIGRGSMYDVSNRISAISDIDAEDVQNIAQRVFRGGKPTYIVVADPQAESYSYKEITKKLMN